jgi:hypothetical protein
LPGSIQTCLSDLSGCYHVIGGVGPLRHVGIKHVLPQGLPAQTPI